MTFPRLSLLPLASRPLCSLGMIAVSGVLNSFPGVSAQESGAGIAASPAVIQPGAEVATPDPQEEKRKLLRAQILPLVPAERHFREQLADSLATTYKERGFRPLWDPAAMPPALYRPLGEALSTHAFPETVALDPDALLPSITDSIVDPKDLAWSIAILDAGLLTRLGAVPAESLWSEWYRDDTPGSEDFATEEIIADLVRATSVQPFDVEKVLETLGPKNWIYRELHRAFPEAKDAILQYSGLPPIPDPASGGVGKPGEAYPYAPAIGAHLADRGYLTLPAEQISALSAMTPELVAALTAFQRDYGLDPDGVFGPASWRYLHTNAADRYRSIMINMHRARLVPGKLGARYIIANLPCAELYLFDENDFHAGTMRIVHGKAAKDTHHTPIFRDVMKEVVFGPYWNVPKSIAVKEVLPKAQEDWGFLSRNRYEIVSDFNPYNKSTHRLSPQNLELVAQGRLFLRQKPGPTNALGHVKFLFPNSFNIYMHDTPAKNFFARTNRDYSHGCIRVSKPEELGAWVLKNQDWTEDQVETAMFADERKSLPVSDEINVYITYFTTFPRPIPGGKVVLAPGRDVYTLDSVDAEKLAAVIPWETKAEPTIAAPVTDGGATSAPSSGGSSSPSKRPADLPPGSITLPSGSILLPDGKIIVP